MEKRGSLRGRHGQASQVWTIVRSLVRPSPTLISSSTRLHPSGSHSATTGLTSWLESNLIIVFLDVRLLALFSGSARFLCPCVRHTSILACVAARLRVTSPPIHLTICLFPSTPRPQLQHDTFRIQAPDHTCYRSYLYDVLNLHLDQHLDFETFRQRRTTTSSITEREGRGWFRKPWKVAKIHQVCKDRHKDQHWELESSLTEVRHNRLASSRLFL